MKLIHEYAYALFGEHYTAAQISKVLINADGEQVNRKTIQKWIDAVYPTPKWALDQLHDKCEKRLIYIKNLIESQ